VRTQATLTHALELIQAHHPWAWMGPASHAQPAPTWQLGGIPLPRAPAAGDGAI